MPVWADEGAAVQQREPRHAPVAADPSDADAAKRPAPEKTASTGNRPVAEPSPQAESPATPISHGSGAEKPEPAVENGAVPEKGAKSQNSGGQDASSANGPRLLTVTFRRSGDIDRDMFRLKELHECIRDPRGRDRFFIRVESKGDLVKLAFPEDPCSISERLTGELTKHFRVEVSVESMA